MAKARAAPALLAACLLLQVGWVFATDLVGLVQVKTTVQEDPQPEQPHRWQPQQMLGKLHELQQKWSEHVDKRIVEIEQAKKEKKEKEEEQEVKEDFERKAAQAALQRKVLPEPAAEDSDDWEDDDEGNDDELVKQLREEASESDEEALAKEKAANETARQLREKFLHEVAKRRAKFGNELSVTVSTAVRSFETTVYENTRLQVLMHSVCSKLGLVNTSEPALFLHGKELDLMSFAAEAGVTNGDVIELKSRVLDAKQKADAEEASRVAFTLREEKEQKARTDEVRARKQRKLDAQIKEVKRLVELKREDMVMLQFIHESGGVTMGEYSIAVRPDNWLQPTVDMLAKRLGLDPAKVRLRKPDGTAIAPHDTVHTLNLKPMTELILHSPYKLI